MSSVSGVLLVDKPSGMTSHDVVARVRRVFGQRDVGHTGTLDPMASGLLILTLGRATRISRFIEAESKRYTGVVTLGRSTATWDAEGESVEEVPVHPVDDNMLAEVVRSLSGRISQTVPPFSAVKVGGERLYKKARRGEVVEAPVRTVEVHALRLATEVASGGSRLHLDAHVSKGTYIRALAVQIGTALGVPAHLSSLRRTSIGRFDVKDARPLDALGGTLDELCPIREALSQFPRVELDIEAAQDVRHGRHLSAQRLWALAGPGVDFGAGDFIVLSTADGSVSAVATAGVASADLAARPPGDRPLRYECVLTEELPA